jgi:hypothetical protein
MFSFPVTVPIRYDDSVTSISVMVDLDKIALVKPLLDKQHISSVGCTTLYELVPHCILLLEDGRQLPVIETADTIQVYLDAYLQLDHFFTAPAKPANEASSQTRGEVIPLFPKALRCDSSEGSIPA